MWCSPGLESLWCSLISFMKWKTQISKWLKPCTLICVYFQTWSNQNSTRPASIKSTCPASVKLMQCWHVCWRRADAVSHLFLDFSNLMQYVFFILDSLRMVLVQLRLFHDGWLCLDKVEWDQWDNDSDKNFGDSNITDWKLDGNNYLQWKRLIEIYVVGREKTSYLLADSLSLVTDDWTLDDNGLVH